MGGVGNELPSFCSSAAASLGLPSGVEAASICASIAFSERPEPSNLCLRLRSLDTLREVARRDRRGRPLDLAERAQAESDDPEPETGDRAEHDQGHEQLDQQEPVQRPEDVASEVAITRMRFGCCGSIEARTR